MPSTNSHPEEYHTIVIPPKIIPQHTEIIRTAPIEQPKEEREKDFIDTSFLLGSEFRSYGSPNDEHLTEAIHIVAVEFLNGFATVLLAIYHFLHIFDLQHATYFFPAQEPRKGTYDYTIQGINFIDILFPAILFCAGISISMYYRRSPGILNFLALAVKKWLGLHLIALFLGNFRLDFTPEAHFEKGPLLISLLAFVCLFMMLIEYPMSLSIYYTMIMRVLGLGGIVAISAAYPFPKHDYFSLKNVDPTFSILATCWIICSIWYMCSSTNIIFRIVPIGLIIAIRIGLSSDYWTSFAWNDFPIPHLFIVSHLQYVIIVLTATVIGDFFFENVDIIQEASVPLIDTYARFRRSFLIVLFVIISLLVTAIVGASPAILSPKMCIIVICIVAPLTVFIRQLIRHIENKSSESFASFKKTIYWGVYSVLMGWIMAPAGLQAQAPTLAFLFLASGTSVLLFTLFFGLSVTLNFSMNRGFFRSAVKLVTRFFVWSGYNSVLLLVSSMWLIPTLMFLFHLGNHFAAYVSVGVILLFVPIWIASWCRVRWYGQYTIEDNIYVLQYNANPFEKMIFMFLNR